MAEDNITSMATLNSQGRIQATICEEPNAMEIEKSEDWRQGSAGDRLGSTQVSGCRNNREVCEPIGGVPLQILCGAGGDQEPPNPGLQTAEPVYPSGTLQDGGNSSAQGDSGEERPYRKVRPQRRIYRNPDPLQVKTISHIQKSRHCIPVQGSKFWIKLCAKSVQQATSVRLRTTKKTRYSTGVLLGRHLPTRTRQRRIAEHYVEGYQAFRSSRLRDQYYEKYTDSNDNTGIPGIHIRHKEDGHQGSGTEDKEANSTDKASVLTGAKVLQMDGESNGQDDCDDSSNRRGSATHQIHAEGSGEITAQQWTRLGEHISDIGSSHGRALVVEELCDEEERPTYKEDGNQESSGDHTYGQLRDRLGCDLGDDRHIRVLDRRREEAVNQRKRVDGHLFCGKATRPKVPRINDQTIHRQHDSFEVHNQIRRNSISSPTRPCSENSAINKPISVASSIPTCSRDREHQSGHTVKDQGSILRDQCTKDSIQRDQETMGAPETGCVCKPSEQSTAKVLESTTRSICGGNGCIYSEVAKDGAVLLPPVETDTTGITSSEDVESQEDGSGGSILDNSTLVPNDHEDEASSESHSLSDQEDNLSRILVIRNKRKEDGLTDGTSKFLEGSIRESTKKAYDNHWRRWVAWCKTKDKDPLEYNASNVAEFLNENAGFSKTHLNCIRSAIASVFNIIHPKERPIAEQPLVKDFFKAKRRQKVKVPKISKLIAWDTDIMIDYVKKNWGDNDKLSLQQLQLKTVITICLATMARPSSDVGRLQHRDVILQMNKEEELTGVILHFREPKEGQMKTTMLGVIQDTSLCTANTLKCFIQRTSKLRSKLPEDHTLFLGYIEQEEDVKPVRKSTVAGWIKEVMKQAGIDTKEYKAHSMRSAACTKAIEKKHEFKDVKTHGHWSLNSNTMEEFYYKPTLQVHNSTNIENSIFTENNTTWNAGVEATKIVLQRTHNPVVAETKAGNVVYTHPWYKRLGRLLLTWPSQENE